MSQPRLATGGDTSDYGQASIDYLWDAARRRNLLRHIIRTILLAGTFGNRRVAIPICRLIEHMRERQTNRARSSRLSTLP